MPFSVMMGLATLWTPFPSLTVDNFLSRGSAGQIFAINANIVFKCATQFTDPAPEQAQESEESGEKIEREKSVYKVLMQHQHRNIVRGILCVPEGIFLQRLECTLQARLDSHTEFPISLDRQSRWIQQLASAMEWLERLGYAHGDLRPANILLDAGDMIKVGDFDSTVRISCNHCTLLQVGSGLRSSISWRRQRTVCCWILYLQHQNRTRTFSRH